MVKPHSRFPAALRAVTSFGFLALAPFARATVVDFVAAASSSSSNWTNANSWTGTVVPVDDLVTDVARFNQASYTNGAKLGSARSIGGLVFGDGSTVTGAITISGSPISIGASGIDVKASAGAVTLSNTGFVLGANQVWNNSSAGALTVGSSISGGFSIEKPGSGTLVLNGGSSSFTGGFTLTAGEARLNRIDSSGPTSTALGSGKVTLKGGTLSSTSSQRTLANDVSLQGNVQFGIAATAGGVTFTGAVDVASDSQLTLFNTGSGFSSGPLTLNGELALILQSSANVISSTISDGTSAHGISISSTTATNNFTLSGNNTYSGGTTLSSGQLWLDVSAINTSSTALGTGTVTLNGGTLDLRGRNLLINALAGSGGTITDTASNGSRTLTIGQGGGSGAFSGNITPSSSLKIIAVTKMGSGIQKLSGANTYTGQTNITGGTLLVNGTHIDASATSSAVNGYGGSSTGHFQIASGATLGGTGRIQGNTGLANSNLVFVQSGGHLAPGDEGIGALTLDSASFAGTGSRVLNMASGAVFDFQLSGTGGTPDQLTFWNYVSGDLQLNNNALNLSLLGPQVAGTYTVSLFQFYSNSGVSIAASSLSGGLTLGALGSGISSAEILYTTNTIDLTYTVTAVVPEPSTCALFGGLAVLALAAGRRRRCLAA